MITSSTYRSENIGAPQRVPRFLSFLLPSTAESFCATQELPSSSGIKRANRRATSAAQTTNAARTHFARLCQAKLPTNEALMNSAYTSGNERSGKDPENE
jgi:hypothetical protein